MLAERWPLRLVRQLFGLLAELTGQLLAMDLQQRAAFAFDALTVLLLLGIKTRFELGQLLLAQHQFLV